MPRAIRFASSGEVSVTCLVPGGGPVDSLFAHGATSPPESQSELAVFEKTLDRFARYGCVTSFDRRETDLSARVRGVPTSVPARNVAASPSASAHGSACSPRREPCPRRSTVKLGAGSRVAFDERGNLELKSVLGRWGLDAVAAV
jgi:hypothetical protein